MDTIKVDIKHRISGAILFSADVDASIGESLRIKAALQIAVKADANLAGADLSGADLADANLAGADLAGADLADANLVRAYLAGANLAGANLADANLADANLSDANLAGADLVRANLVRANLAGAYLVRANLAGAYLAGAYLVRANLAAHLGQPNGWNAWTYIGKDGIQRVCVGCKDKTIAEGREYWANKPDRREVLAAIDYAEQIANLRGWFATEAVAA